MTHNFNLTEVEQNAIFDVISALQSMIDYEGDLFINLAERVLELIYGKPKSDDIIKTIEKWFWENLTDSLKINLDVSNGEEFFEKNGHLEIIQQTFTK